jgi:hypothetical protein
MFIKIEFLSFFILILLVNFALAVNNIGYSIEDNFLKLKYEGEAPFLINVRNDNKIGDLGGYLWMKTNSKSKFDKYEFFEIDGFGYRSAFESEKRIKKVNYFLNHNIN